MSTMLLDGFCDTEVGEARRPEAVGLGSTEASHGLTLDELITGVWEGLCARSVAPCPVCGGAMRSLGSRGSGAIDAACSDCGSGLD